MSDNLFLVQPTNTVLAAGECLMLSGLSAQAGAMQVHALAHSLETAAEADTLWVLYEGEDASSRIALGYALLAFLTPTMGKIYETGFRTLSAAERRSGESVWLTEAVAPLGHQTALFEKLGEALPEVPRFWYMSGGAGTSRKNTSYRG